MRCKVRHSPIMRLTPTLTTHASSTTDYAITHNLTPFISMQNHYSLLYREEEREMFPTLKVSIEPI